MRPQLRNTETITEKRWCDVNVIEPGHVCLGIDAVKMDWLHGTSRRKRDLPAEPSPNSFLNLLAGLVPNVNERLGFTAGPLL